MMLFTMMLILLTLVKIELCGELVVVLVGPTQVFLYCRFFPGLPDYPALA
jgi:hypothetical protein